MAPVLWFGGVVTISKISGQLSGRAGTARRVGARANQSRKRHARHDQKSALASPRKRPPTGAQRPQPGQILSAPLRLCVSALKTGANQNAKAQRRQVAINQTESRSPPNAPAQRPRATKVRIATQTRSRGSLQPVGSATCSFNLKNLRPTPTNSP